MKANAEGQGDGDVNVGDFILSSTRTTKKHVGCCSFTANEKSKCMLNNFNIQMCGMYVEFNQYIFNIFVGKKIHWNYVPKKNQNVIHLRAEEGYKMLNKFWYSNELSVIGKKIRWNFKPGVHFSCK